VFASFAALAFVLVSVASPISQNEAAAAVVVAEAEAKPTQALAVAGDYSTVIVRDSYGVTAKPIPVVVPPKPAPAPVAKAAPDASTAAPAAPAPAAPPTPAPAPAASAPDPGSAKSIAYNMVLARGWGADQFSCLEQLWQKESGWNTFANNPSSGAYGIPQSLPGSKMASAGGDWATNPATQITWGLGYIGDRYGSPCGAWNHSIANNWY